MEVVFDTSVTDFDRGGTLRYTDALLPHLAAAGVDWAPVAMTRAWPWTRRLPRAARLLVHDAAWVPAGSVAIARRLSARLYHGAGFKVPILAPIRTSVTIHDDTPWDTPPTARLYNRQYMRRDLEAAAPRLAGAITSMAGTAEAILQRLPALRGKLHATPWGVDHELFRPREASEVAAARARAGINGPYVLIVSPYGPRKNEATMLEALGQARAASPGLSALVVGRHNPPGADPLPVVRCGRVSDADLAALYSGAELLLYASLKEGFGLPLLEAMACGCPVVTSSGTVLEEVAGGAAELADPASVTAIARACAAVMEDAGERSRLVTAGLEHAAAFTWARTASLTVAAWRAMM
ncbi:MAG: glycosyltransferase family 1 protein [Candidatus Dormibacteria bacterium]